MSAGLHMIPVAPCADDPCLTSVEVELGGIFRIWHVTRRRICQFERLFVQDVVDGIRAHKI